MAKKFFCLFEYLTLETISALLKLKKDDMYRTCLKINNMEAYKQRILTFTIYNKTAMLKSHHICMHQR